MTEKVKTAIGCCFLFRDSQSRGHPTYNKKYIFKLSSSNCDIFSGYWNLFLIPFRNDRLLLCRQVQFQRIFMVSELLFKLSWITTFLHPSNPTVTGIILLKIKCMEEKQCVIVPLQRVVFILSTKLM